MENMENKIKKIFEISILTIYTFFTFKIVHPFLTYEKPEWVPDGDIMCNNDIVTLLNRNLLAIVVGLFLNATLIIYLRVLPKKYMEVIVLAIYTFINFKLLSIFLSNFNEVIYSANYWHVNLNFLGLFIGLFLNIGLIFYWLRRK